MDNLFWLLVLNFDIVDAPLGTLRVLKHGYSLRTTDVHPSIYVPIKQTY